MTNHPSYKQIAERIAADSGFSDMLIDGEGLDEEEAEHDTHALLVRPVVQAMNEARHDGAAALGGMIGLGLAIRDRYEELSEWQMGYIEGASEGEKCQRELEDFIAEKIFPVAERIRIHRSFR